MIASIAIMLVASAIAQPQFEVASIKPSPPGTLNGGMSGGPGTKDPGLFTCENVDLLSLVIVAYDIPRYRFSGPDWLRSTRFNISAKIPEGTTKEQFRSMQQSLLVERFKLTLHHENKEMQMYDLVVGKNGPKITQSPENPPPADPDAPSPPPGPPKLDKDGFPIPPIVGRQWRTAMAGRRMVQPFYDATMDRFAAYLANSIGRPVNDATGLKGKYDFNLKWVLDWGGPPTDDSSPTIFEALQQQLGMKLESKKGMVDVLVVDHVEKTPTEN
jgi:uncharacterized protein (TIGR03435 family)